MVVAKSKKKWVEEIEKNFTPKERTKEVPLSIIIPTYNCSVSLDLTLSTLQRQNYHPLEVIVIDAGSTDKTDAILTQYSKLITRVYKTAAYDLPEMINRGAALATGDYLSILYPHCSYICDRSLDIFAEAVLDSHQPDLVICNAPLPFSQEKSQILKELKNGYSPSAFAGCWLRSKFFIDIGKLDTRCKLCYSFDLFCRLSQAPDAKVVRLERTLIDHSQAPELVQYHWQQLGEIGKILKSHFGYRTSIKWFLKLRFSLLVKVSWKSLKEHLFEKS